jgi:ATP-dependent helicase Lhr and Lhr-like helicase
VPALRRARNAPADDAELRVSASDPLNLVGILTPGPRVPAGHTRWLILRGGAAVGVVDRDGRNGLA